MSRNRTPYETRRKNLRLRADLVDFHEGALLAKPEEARIGYGFNELVNGLLERNMHEIMAAAGAASVEGFGEADASSCSASIGSASQQGERE